MTGRAAARALITGVGGQDGSYLAERLVAEGTEVHALVHPDEPLPERPGVTLHACDVADLDRTRALVLDLAPDELYNLAAISSVARSWAEPDLVARVNGLAVAGLLESAWLAQEASGRPVRFVQASSAEIFGSPCRSPQDESTPVRPLNPYGAAKAYAHHLVGVYRERGLHASGLVLYNHESPRRPVQFVTRKITSTVAAIAQGRAEVLRLGNLEARRDWGWAPDYVEAMTRSARAERADDYVVATGESHSVRDLVASAFAHVGITDWEQHVEVDQTLVRPTDAAELVGDASKIRAAVGWRPTATFHDVVTRLVDADLAR